MTRLRSEIAERLVELEPLVHEAADLEAALSQLERDARARQAGGTPPADGE